MEDPPETDETINAAVLAFLASDGKDLAGFLSEQPSDLRDSIATACRDAQAIEGLLERDRPPLGAPTWTPVALTRQPPAGKDARWIGEFQIIETLGEGGMGVVYLAWQRSLDRQVALKVLPRGSAAIARTVERFQREVRAAGKLAHPGIVPVLGVFEADGIHHFAMEYVEGDSLAAHLKALKDELNRLSPVERADRLDGAHAARVAEIGAALADALDYAHTHGVVHRDVKPQNVLIDSSGRPRLCDFGLAKAAGDDSLSIEGELTGTPFYMSLEQADAKRGPAGPKSDVYSLGVVLYEALTLERPFAGDSIQAVLFAIAYDDAIGVREHNPRVPKDLETICHKAIEKNVDRRYVSAAALAADLRRFLAHEAIEARPPTVLDTCRRALARNRNLAIVIGIAILVVSLAIPLTRDLARLRALRLNLQAAAPLVGLSVDELAGSALNLLHDAAGSLDLAAERLDALPAQEQAGYRALRADLAAVGRRWLESAQRLQLEDAQSPRDNYFDEARKLISDAGPLTTSGEPLYERLNKHDAFFPRLSIRTSDGESGDLVVLEKLDDLTWAVTERREIGTTPIVDLPVARAEYRITVVRPGIGWFEATRPIQARSRTYTIEAPLRPSAEVTADMCHVPAGPFLYGIPGATNYPFLTQREEHTEAFWIDATEVSNAQYRQFVEETNHRAPAYWPAPYDQELDPLPVVGVAFEDARTYAEWAGKRLPTACEWEKAARGLEGRDWPWDGGIELGDQYANVGGLNVGSGAGDSPASTLARYFAGVEPVDGGNRPKGPFGLVHTLGNVAEWTETVYVRMTEHRPSSMTEARVYKGGAWSLPPTHWTLSNFDGELMEARTNTIGFRCAKSELAMP